MPINCDSLIFDMDGTLWDAVDSYRQIWDKTFAEQGIDMAPVTRETLLRHMGKHLEDIVAELAPADLDYDSFTTALDINEREMMPRLGGRLYEGVYTTIRELSRTKQLFMVSNCGSSGLANFLRFSNLEQFMTDSLSHGGTGLDKAGNISRLIETYGLEAPMYVGDTQGDSNSAHRAGAGMIFCAYGFGHVTDAEYTINDIRQLTELVK